MSEPLYKKVGLSDGQSMLAAAFLVYLMDLFTNSGKETFTRAEVVTIIQGVAESELPESAVEWAKQDGNGI